MDFYQFIESFKLTFLGICKIKVKFTNSFMYKIYKFFCFGARILSIMERIGKK
jgi:hypothetical protein